jgi:hypothetical protein
MGYEKQRRPIADRTGSPYQTKADLLTTVSSRATVYTLALADANSVQRITGATGRAFTIPPNSDVAFPIGTWVDFVQDGAGAITITAGVGVTLQKLATKTLVTGGAGAVARARKVLTDTWVVSGDLTAA